MQYLTILMRRRLVFVNCQLTVVTGISRSSHRTVSGGRFSQVQSFNACGAGSAKFICVVVLQVPLSQHMYVYCRCYLVSVCVASHTWSVCVLQVLLGQCMCCRFYLVSACVAGSTWSVHVLQVLLGQCMCCRFYLVSACVAGSTWSVHVL